jgi:hypothetical protein
MTGLTLDTVCEFQSTTVEDSLHPVLSRVLTIASEMACLLGLITRAAASVSRRRSNPK